MSKTETLHTLLHTPGTECLIEAHNGMSARIVEESGAKGIWASGLALSAQYGVRDSNEASWTQIVDMLEFMSDVTSIPILLDGDTGYGNFNNMRRLVKKLEQRKIAGVCIEDKEFPKTNSFIDPHRQALASCEEFCGKIRAGKDSQEDEHFCIVARTEALITGQGIAEALYRAECYRDAGADAILIHSKSPRADEVLEFAQEWADRSPLIVIPTTYYSTPIEVFENMRIRLVIWANHLIRSCITSMRKTAREIVRTRSARTIEDGIAPVQELFRLQSTEELAAAEARYLAAPPTTASAIILAASRGSALQGLTERQPKVMLSINGKTLLAQLLELLRKQGIHDITLVAGYKRETIQYEGICCIANENYADNGELSSLFMAKKAFSNDMFIMYGDLLLRGYILRDLQETPGDIVVIVDSNAQRDASPGDSVWCDHPDNRALFRQNVQLLRTNRQAGGTDSADDTLPSGQWIGLMRVRGQGREWLDAALQTLQDQDDFATKSLPDLLGHLVDCGHPVHVHYIQGHWLNINTAEDVRQASGFKT